MYPNIIIQHYWKNSGQPARTPPISPFGVSVICSTAKSRLNAGFTRRRTKPKKQRGPSQWRRGGCCAPSHEHGHGIIFAAAEHSAPGSPASRDGYSRSSSVTVYRGEEPSSGTVSSRFLASGSCCDVRFSSNDIFLDACIHLGAGGLGWAGIVIGGLVFSSPLFCFPLHAALVAVLSTQEYMWHPCHNAGFCQSYRIRDSL